MADISSYKKNWMRYERYLMSGEWHVHTNYVDGRNTVDDYCKRAVELKIPLIAFTEHVRRVLTYNYRDLVEDVKRARENYPDLIILTGCEAKVLEDGSLDVSDEVLKESEIVLMAFHSFPERKARYVEALTTALSNHRVDIWAHPGSFLRAKNFGLNDAEVEDILVIAAQRNVLIEVNEKYGLPPDDWVETGKRIGVKFVRGSDVHSVEELK